MNRQANLKFVSRIAFDSGHQMGTFLCFYNPQNIGNVVLERSTGSAVHDSKAVEGALARDFSCTQFT